jgi:hypothetical protein
VAEAARLIADPRAVHFWDGNDLMGEAYRTILRTPARAWDVYLLFSPGTRWPDGPPPAPVFWMHQLSKVSHAPKLDARVLGQEIDKLSTKNWTH